MEIGALQFPILFIADDGWVEHAKTKSDLANWTRLGVTKYEVRKIVVLDASDKAWKVTKISTDPPMNRLRKFLAYTIYNPKVRVRIDLEPLSIAPIEAARNALNTAIDADDDVLTQNISAEGLREAIERAQSPREIVAVLRRAGAI